MGGRINSKRSANRASDAPWPREKVLQVAVGMFMELGVLRKQDTANDITALMNNDYKAAKVTPYQRLGMDLAVQLREIANDGVLTEEGLPLIDIDNFGYVIAGREQTLSEALMNAGGAVVQSTTGIDVDGDSPETDGLMDAVSQALASLG